MTCRRSTARPFVTPKCFGLARRVLQLLPTIDAGTLRRLQEVGMLSDNEGSGLSHSTGTLALGLHIALTVFGAMQESAETWACRKPLLSQSRLHSRPMPRELRRKSWTGTR